ncbi:hypothetical protein SB767_30575, partial [Bacillus sp. SIMBA_069]
SSAAPAAVHLSGSTKDGNIVGIIGDGGTLKLAPHSTTTITFHLTTAASVPVKTTTPQLSFEAYLDQVNRASGSGTTLADTYSHDVRITAAT